ncbi:MAG: efflux RND transporter permease subunit, partial [Myxococcota bacterium]
SSHSVAQRWRELAGPISDAVELKFSSDGFSAGAAFHIELRGADVEVLTQATTALKERLATRAGVRDINDSFRRGKREAQLAIRPEAELLGLSLDDLARQVRQAFYGEEVQRIQRGRDDLRVMLRYPDQERRSLGDLEAMQIRTADGAEVPFSSVARVTHGRGYATIRRTDRMRVVEVVAAVDRKQLTPEDLAQSVQAELPALLARFPGVSFDLAGEQREHGNAMGSLVNSGILALLLIYALLAIPLRSYQQPLIIMSVIPFGAVGAILGHLLMGWELVFFSVLGIVALSGVVVNASLVLVHYVNRRRGEGASVFEAVTSAGVARFRPIVLTSMTTYIGLVPLMFESDIQARMMIPMAISLGYGVLFASVFTLFLVPCLYVILEDLRHLRIPARDKSIASEPKRLADAR